MKTSSLYEALARKSRLLFFKNLVAFLAMGALAAVAMMVINPDRSVPTTFEDNLMFVKIVAAAGGVYGSVFYLVNVRLVNKMSQ